MSRFCWNCFTFWFCAALSEHTGQCDTAHSQPQMCLQHFKALFWAHTVSFERGPLIGNSSACTSCKTWPVQPTGEQNDSSGKCDGEIVNSFNKSALAVNNQQDRWYLPRSPPTLAWQRRVETWAECVSRYMQLGLSDESILNQPTCCQPGASNNKLTAPRIWIGTWTVKETRWVHRHRCSL